VVEMRIEFLIFRFQKLSWSWIRLHWGIELVSFQEWKSTYNLFNILALREWNLILHKLHKDTQYVFRLSELFDLEFRLQQISKFFIGLFCFWHNQNAINIDEKQNFIFNQQAWCFWADLESNGFQEISESKVSFSSRLSVAIDALLK
jgi:hypothetical protein